MFSLHFRTSTNLASFSGFDGIYQRGARRGAPLFTSNVTPVFSPFYSSIFSFIYLYRLLLFCFQTTAYNRSHHFKRKKQIKVKVRKYEISFFRATERCTNPPSHLYDWLSTYEASSAIDDDATIDDEAAIAIDDIVCDPYDELRSRRLEFGSLRKFQGKT